MLYRPIKSDTRVFELTLLNNTWYGTDGKYIIIIIIIGRNVRDSMVKVLTIIVVN